MIWTFWTGLGAVFAATGVLLGAFGAHALKVRVAPEDLAIFETGVRYQMYHALALLGVGFVASKVDANLLKICGWLFTVGILIFSGSLYALVLSGVRVLGAITPIGGVCLIVAWTLLAIVAFRSQYGV